MKSTYFVTVMVLMLLVVGCGPTDDSPPTVPATAPTDEALPQTQQSAYPGPASSGYPAPVPTGTEVLPAAIPRFEGKIAFHSDRGGTLQLFLLDGQTGTLEQLVTGAAQAYEPQWSPDCDTIAYTHESNLRGDTEIHLVGANGQGSAALLEEARPSTLDWAPAWSPNGDLVAYQTNPEKLMNICFSDLDGMDQGCLERGDYSNAHPSWSPDGERLLFISNREGPWNIYVMSMTDREPVKLTDNLAIDFHPRFSPDGNSIVFESNRLANYDIYLMDADGSDVQRLTDSAADDVDPFWMGEDILFASEESGDWELYMLDRNGGDATRLTYNPGVDKGPAWCPAD